MSIRPTVDFDDKYLNAKCKVIECIIYIKRGE